eukprot:scaffold455179_cov18-Prasinocladus_malaysianus.AAC.1
MVALAQLPALGVSLRPQRCVACIILVMDLYAFTTKLPRTCVSMNSVRSHCLSLPDTARGELAVQKSKNISSM